LTYLLYPLLLLILAALVYQVLALVSLARLFSARPGPPLPEPPPGVTVLKPVKGLEPDSRACLESFLTQDYPAYEVLFGVADQGDAVLPLLDDLVRAHPQRPARVVVCTEVLGQNPKVSILRQLEPLARHDLLVVADGDVKVGEDFLQRVAAGLAEPGVGLVSCLYRAGPARTLGSALEALTISADFIPSVAVARQVEGIRFALGAALALPRQVLARLGGFAAIADHLADDYQLGWQVHRLGLRVDLLPYVVETVNPHMTLAAYFLHQLRWSRTYRVCRPGGYLAFGVTHGLVFALVLWLASGLAGWALELTGAVLALRAAVALASERLYLRGRLRPGAFLLLPVKDLLAFALWLLSFSGDTVTWRGRRFRLRRDGALMETQKEDSGRK